MKSLLVIAIVLSSVFLSSCVFEQRPELKVFVDEVRARPAGKIEPLPSFDEYDSFTYSAAGIRSPFRLILASKEEASASGKSEIFPDFERSKEPLEAYTLSELSMVGTVTKPDGYLWALIENPEGVISAIKYGQYLGKNFGKVTDVTTKKISILEIVPDGPGRWIERPQVMTLKGMNNE